MAFFNVETGLIEESSFRRFDFIKGVFSLKPLGERLESDKVGRSHDLANGGQNYAAQNKSANKLKRMNLIRLSTSYYKLKLKLQCKYS